jgi:hypothetical protein
MAKPRNPKTTNNPDRNGFYRWVVEIEVHETWVEDGFSLDDEKAHDMMMHRLPYANGHELKARVLSSPPEKSVRKAQGYKD